MEQNFLRFSLNSGTEIGKKEKGSSLYNNLGIKLPKKSASIIYHKSSCITCKKTLSEFDRLKIDIQKRDFFKEPFSETELKKIIKLSGKSPKEFLRKRDKMYKELKLDTTQPSDSKIIKLMTQYPGLILRPIIIKNDRIMVGKVNPKNLN